MVVQNAYGLPFYNNIFSYRYVCIRISGAIGGALLWVVFGVAVAIFFGTWAFLWGVVIEIGNRNYHLKELELDEMEEAKRQKNKKTQKPTNPDSIIKGAN
jgi:phosphate/sulfate permease